VAGFTVRQRLAQLTPTAIYPRTLVEGRYLGTALDMKKHSGSASLNLKILTGGPLARAFFDSVAACLADAESVLLDDRK